MRRVVVVAVLIATACGGSSPGPAGEREAAESRVDLLFHDPTAGSMDALGTFTLVWDPDLNCLYHNEPDNNGEPGTGGRVVIAWPPGYSARAEAGGVTVFNEKGEPVAETGVRFQLGGGGGPYRGGYCDGIGLWSASSAPIPMP